MNPLKLSLTNSQAEFVALTQDKECDCPLFVGGPGCGKSYILALTAVLFAQHSKDAAIYIYAPEHHHIRQIEVPNVLLWLDRFKIKNKGFNSQENMIKVEDPNCGNFYFKTMDNPAALVGYQSYAALVDELDTLPESKADEIWRAILMRNRLQPEDVAEEHRVVDENSGKLVCHNKALVFTTPEGYNFCYKNWELDPQDGYKQVKGRTRDNPVVTSKYLKSVTSRFAPHVAEKYLVGEFVNMQSLSVYFNYDPKTHDSFEEVQPGENLYIGCDFNVNNTAATIYVRRDGGREWHAVDEMCGIKDAHTLAQLIYDRYAKKGHHVTMYPDCTGKGRSNSNSANLSSIAELEAKGFTIRANSKNFMVQDRINASNNGFMQGRVFVNQRLCPTVSRCLVNQAYDKDGKPDKKSGYDHQNDATTYPLVFEMGVGRKLFKIDFNFVRRGEF